MLQEKIDELNLLDIEQNSPLYEYRNRINKYVNAILQNQISLEDYDDLLKDFDQIKLSLSNEELEKSELVWQLKENIKLELYK